MPACFRWCLLLLLLSGAACSRSALLSNDDGGGGASSSAGSGGSTSARPPDTCAAVAWTRNIGGPGEDELLAIARGPRCRSTVFGRHDEPFEVDGRAVPHGEANDAFVVQLNGAGETRWAQGFVTQGNVEEVAGTATSDGGVVLVTNLAGDATVGTLALTSAGASDAIAVAFDAGGEVKWSLQLGDELSQFGTAVTSDPQGNVYIAGRFRGGIDVPGGPLLSSGNNFTAFVVKVDEDGTPVWGFQLPPDATVVPNDLTWDDGRLYLTGALSGNPLATPVLDMLTEDVDAFLCLISADSGTYIEGLSFPSPGFDAFNGVVVAPTGVFLSGVFEDAFFAGSPLFSVGGLDGMAVVLSLELFPLAVVGFQGPGNQSVTMFAPGGSDGGVVGGRFEQSMSSPVGPPPTLTTRANADGFFLASGASGLQALGADTEAEVSDAIFVAQQRSALLAGTFSGGIAPPSPNAAVTSAGSRDVFVMLRPTAN